METNPYTYKRNQTEMTQYNLDYQDMPGRQNKQQFFQPQLQKLPQHSTGQKPRIPAKMPKARVQALANALKRTVAVASIISFGMFGGLAAMHQVNTTVTQSISKSTNTSSNQNTSSQSSNNFLKQQGGNINSGTSSNSANNTTSSSSTSSGTSSSSTSATPVTGTTTS